MAKNVKTDQSNAGEDKQQLDELVQSGQGDTVGGEQNPPPPQSRDKPKGKSTEPDYANQTRRSGDKCPRPGCLGTLTVMSTHKGKEFRIRHLACNSCKRVGGKEVSPI